MDLTEMDNVSDFFKTRMKGQIIDPPSRVWEDIDHRMVYQEEIPISEEEETLQQEEELQKAKISVKLQTRTISED